MSKEEKSSKVLDSYYENCAFPKPKSKKKKLLHNGLILSILVYTLFSRMFDLMQPPAVKHSIAVV